MVMDVVLLMIDVIYIHANTVLYMSGGTTMFSAIDVRLRKEMTGLDQQIST